MDTQITNLLRRIQVGDAEACQELMPLIYAELRTIAGKYLRKERKSHTLQPTALVNEVYIRMFGAVTPKVADKAHFLAVASQVMRRILVDYARTKASGKRGGDLRQVDAAGWELGTERREFLPLLELDRALDQLAVENPVLARAIEMRYFGGLTAEEAAEVTGRSSTPCATICASRKHGYAGRFRESGRRAAAPALRLSRSFRIRLRGEASTGKGR